MSSSSASSLADAGAEGHVSLDTERCRGCLLCVPICPNALFSPGQTPNAAGAMPARLDAPEYCINCLRCVDICPDRALTPAAIPAPVWPGYVYGLSLRWHRFWGPHDR
ncbi:MAG: 4Fe-4S dicluster domain-containing protein [Candidatus Sericytochromatia bacterium]